TFGWSCAFSTAPVSPRASRPTMSLRMTLASCGWAHRPPPSVPGRPVRKDPGNQSGRYAHFSHSGTRASRDRPALRISPRLARPGRRWLPLVALAVRVDRVQRDDLVRVGPLTGGRGDAAGKAMFPLVTCFMPAI